VAFYQNNESSVIDLDDGGDTVDLQDVIYSTIKTGAGDDTVKIQDNMSYVELDAGADNDVISFQGSNNNIKLLVDLH
jgi:hypothetical protein